MCLNVPARIISVKNNKARVKIADHLEEVSLELLDKVRPGDYVIVQQGFATAKVNKKQAQYILDLINHARD